jgi:hypothetical protein
VQYTSIGSKSSVLIVTSPSLASAGRADCMSDSQTSRTTAS